MRVYHGTTAEHAASILADGLRAGACVALDEGLAWYYAEAACDEEGGDEVVLCADVDERDLLADDAALCEPVGWGVNTGSQIEQELDRLGRSRATSLTVCASARIAERVDGWQRV